MNTFPFRVRENVGGDDLLFGFICDTHFEEKADPRDYGANALAHIRDFAEAGRECGASFLIHAGDLTNGNRPKAQTRREITLCSKAMHSAGLPVFFAIGNHDDNTYFCRDHPGCGDNALTGMEWQNLVQPSGLPAGTVAAPGVGNCFYRDFPEHRVRLLVLNTIDLPLERRPDGNLKYYTINDHGFSKAQLAFVAHKALDFSPLPDSERWGLLIVSHMSFGFLPNGAAMEKILHSFQTGGRCRTTAAEVKRCPFEFNGFPCFPSPADPVDLVHEVEADFCGQGPREVIAHLYGHEHLDLIRRKNGYPEVALLSSLCYRNSPEAPARRFGSASEEAWNMVALNRGKRELKFFRYGAGNDFSLRGAPAFEEGLVLSTMRV